MDIMDEQGTKIGQVKSIQNFGAGDLIKSNQLAVKVSIFHLMKIMFWILIQNSSK